MNVEGNELKSVWTNVVPSDASLYTVASVREPWLVGCTRDGWPALLRRLHTRPANSDRTVGSLRLRLLPDAELQIAGIHERVHLAALECREARLLDTFVALGLDMMKGVGDGPVSGDQLQARLDAWRDLLMSHETMSVRAQLGLWGELEVLGMIPDATVAVESWHGPDREALDFTRASVGLEVKTSTRLHEHTLRWAQAVFTQTSLETYLVSVNVVVDNAAGRSLGEQVARTLERFDDPYRLRLKLLSAGFVEGDAAKYDTKWKLIQVNAFPMSQVPHFVSIPDGASEVKWHVNLSGKRYLSDRKFAAVLRKLAE